MTNTRPYLLIGVSVVMVVLMIFTWQNYSQLKESQQQIKAYETIQKAYDEEAFEEQLDNELARYNELNASYKNLQEDYKQLVDKHDGLQISYDQLKILAEAGPELLSKDSQWSLVEKFGDDYLWIREDLLNHSEVIERPGVLGGTMRFINTYLLTDRLALGVFEDGHIMGTGIYEFQKVSNEQVRWSVVVEYVDGEE